MAGNMRSEEAKIGGITLEKLIFIGKWLDGACVIPLWVLVRCEY